MRRWIAASAFLLGLGLATGSQARCLSYEPTQVTLVGTLTSRSLPGPPNYRSIAHGDYPETVFMLTLDEPICVSGDASDRLNWRSHAGVTELQVVAGDIDIERFLHKRVRASGSLFSAHMDQHRTPVVLKLAKLRDT